MAEQQTPVKTESPVEKKVELSAGNVNCRFCYDCLMASTKAFVNSFNLLTKEEKAGYKSLNTYVKQLEKCMQIIKNPDKPLPTPKRTSKPKADGVTVEETSKAKKESPKKTEPVVTHPVTPVTPVVTPPAPAPAPVAHAPEPEKPTKKTGGKK